MRSAVRPCTASSAPASAISDSRHDQRPLPGKADDESDDEISEEVLDQPMQPEPDLPVDRDQRGGGDGRKQMAPASEPIRRDAMPETIPRA